MEPHKKFLSPSLTMDYRLEGGKWFIEFYKMFHVVFNMFKVHDVKNNHATSFSQKLSRSNPRLVALMKGILGAWVFTQAKKKRKGL